MEELLLKYNALDGFSRKLVLDFIELLLKGQTRNLTSVRTSENKIKINQLNTLPDEVESAKPAPPFDYESYKKSLLAIPPWSDEEVAEFDANLATFKNWKIEEW